MEANMDEFITLGQAAQITPGGPGAGAIWRWCRYGVQGRNGVRIHLKHTRFGGRIYTTRRWLDEFGQELAEADAGHFNITRDAFDTRQRQIAKAERELEGIGL
jgi:hypothetical protein